MTHPSIIICLALSICLPVSGDDPVIIDGQFMEWNDSHLEWIGPAGDSNAIDFLKLWIRDEAQRLYIAVEASEDFDLSENNDVTLLLDTDNNAATGLASEGIGAEIRFLLGQRTGSFYPSPTTNPNSGIQIWHSDISFEAAPTVTSTTFEISIDLEARIKDIELFTGSSFAMVMNEPNGNRIPILGEGIEFQLGNSSEPPAVDSDFEKDLQSDIRLVSWNVKFDTIFEDDESPKFERILTAIQPDVINFQEIYNNSTNEVRDLVEDWLTLSQGDWYAAGNNDCKTVSKFPILYSQALSGNLAVLLDTTSVLKRTLLIINAHTPCCGNDEGRQEEIDEMLQLVREVREGSHSNIPSDCALQITGDLNLVGLAQQLESLIDGNIINEDLYGPDVNMDVDGSDLLDTLPTHTQQRTTYTWRNDFSSFWPGRLDCSVISDSVLELGRSFVIETRSMSAERLAQYQLDILDSSASDHLPLVTDVRIPGTNTRVGDLNNDGSVDGADLGIFLNAWNTSTEAADFDGDGTVGGADLGILLLNWNS